MPFVEIPKRTLPYTRVMKTMPSRIKTAMMPPINAIKKRVVAFVPN